MIALLICTAPPLRWATAWWCTDGGRLIWPWLLLFRPDLVCPFISTKRTRHSKDFWWNAGPWAWCLKWAQYRRTCAVTTSSTRPGLALQAVLEALAAVIDGSARYPDQLVVHRHLGSMDLPREHDGGASALIHPQFQNSDWVPLRKGDPMFIHSRRHHPDVFEGEMASYRSSLTRRLMPRKRSH